MVAAMSLATSLEVSFSFGTTSGLLVDCTTPIAHTSGLQISTLPVMITSSTECTRGWSDEIAVHSIQNENHGAFCEREWESQCVLWGHFSSRMNRTTEHSKPVWSQFWFAGFLLVCLLCLDVGTDLGVKNAPESSEGASFIWQQTIPKKREECLSLMETPRPSSYVAMRR